MKQAIVAASGLRDAGLLCCTIVRAAHPPRAAALRTEGQPSLTRFFHPDDPAQAGAKRSLHAPFEGDQVHYLKAQGGDKR